MTTYVIRVLQDDYTHKLYDIPVDAACKSDAIEVASKLKECFKEGYVLQILETTVTYRSCGYMLA